MNRLSRAIQAFFDAWRAPAQDIGALPAQVSSPSPGEFRRQGAAQALLLLQRGGRLIDFLHEELDSYSDQQIGAAVREIHRNCRKVIEEHFPMSPILEGQEGTEIVPPSDLSAAAVRWAGLTAGPPPSRGVLQHHGWRLNEVRIPDLSETADPMIIAPAQVEAPESGA
ncbi:MAG: DUF2760 domain-containing protein [Verrucomicrobiota bacterium]|jgi:hypothetical protein|nr:DUF2760 domain-containing protein [Verrucomicrobiota bacterium]